jgi:tetratricopeptide (TPR) repeat protein
MRQKRATSHGQIISEAKPTILPICVIIASLILVLGCGIDPAKRKKQSEDLRNLGEAYLQKGNSTSALRELLKAQEAFADDPILQNDLGLAYRAKERLDLAITHFKRAVELDPSYAPARNNLGEAYLHKKDWDAAIAILDELRNNLLYTTPHFTHINMGRAYYGKGNYPKAQEYFEAAVKHYDDGFAKDFNYLKALRGLGQAYLAQNMVLEAETVLEQAVTAAPNLAPLHFELAKIYFQAKKFHKAQTSYQRVIELAPNSAMARDAKIELQRLIQRQ